MGKKRKKQKKRQQEKNNNQIFSVPDLIIAIDRSQKRLQKTRVTIYSWVEIRKGSNHQRLKRTGGWLRHVAELPKDQRAGYRKKFYDKFPTKIRPFFDKVEITPNPNVFKKRLEGREYGILLLEDKLYEKQKLPTNKAIKESIAKKNADYRPIMLVADNVAYFGREVYEKKYNNKPIPLAEIKARLRKLRIKLVEQE